MAYKILFCIFSHFYPYFQQRSYITSREAGLTLSRISYEFVLTGFASHVYAYVEKRSSPLLSAYVLVECPPSNRYIPHSTLRGFPSDMWDSEWFIWRRFANCVSYWLLVRWPGLNSWQPRIVLSPPQTDRLWNPYDLLSNVNYTILYYITLYILLSLWVC